MKAYLSSLFVFAILFCSCTSKNNLNDLLSTDKLNTQIFSVNKNRDTTLVTQKGIVINIQKESLVSDSSTIKLEINEALTNEEIVLAGLTTMSGKQTLSSGGMLYIDAAKGYEVTIKKELEVLVPTKNYNADMSVYTGKEENGKIDWVNPQPLPNDTLQRNIKIGEQIFKANCSNCHKIDNDYTGPMLAGASTRYKKKWIYDFINNPAGIIAKNKQGQELFQKWKPTVMTAFPALTHNDIDAILAYADTKSKRKFYPTILPEYNGACEDSCMKYIAALENLENAKADLQWEKENDNTEFFTLDRSVSIPPQIVNSNNNPSVTIPEGEYSWVTSDKITATFYTINIKTFGWYNIDILLKEYSDCIPSELFVRLQTKYETNFKVMLIIPSLKAFVEGGKLQDDKLYGFDETNGKIKLPQNAPCTIIALTEVDGKLIFGKANFNAGLKQTIDINFTETTKEGLAAEIKALKLDGVEAEVKNSDIGSKLKVLNNEATAIEKLKPINCDCNLPEKVSADSTKLIK
jgi:mono/diheme cytochrome c family protein